MLIGLVGKPSVGKSTFFKAATLAEADIASYPFTTIKANHGVAYVKVEDIGPEFNVVPNPNKGFILGKYRFVPVELMDVAGLVEGASEGKGLGNQFLDDLRKADCFIHVLDVSGTTDKEGKPTESHDPTIDIRFLENELDQWYYNIMKKAWHTFARSTEAQKSKLSEAVAKQFSGLRVSEDQVKEALKNLNLSERPTQWTEDEIKKFARLLRIRSKPMIIAANKVDLPNGEENYRKLRENFPNLNIFPCSADSELALRQAAKAGLIGYIPGDRDFKIIREISDKQKEALEKIKKNSMNHVGGTGVQSVLNSAVFGLLDYIAIFPTGATKLGDSKGNILPDCFLLPNGSTALDFANFLHTDFGKNFIKAIDARTKVARGKEYKLKHRDALEIVSR